MTRLFARLFAVLLCLPLPTTRAADAPDVDPATLARIRDAAMSSDWAYQRLTDLADLVGQRLSGSVGAEAAVAQVAAAQGAPLGAR